MRRFLLVLALSAALAGAGCTLLQHSGPEETPPWERTEAITEPAGAFISAVGVSSGEGDPQQMQDEAQRQARQSLAVKMSEYTEKVLADFVQAHPDYAAAAVSLRNDLARTLSAEVPSGMLRHAQRGETWTADSGRTYVLYRIPVALVNDEVVARLRGTLQDANPFSAHPAQVVSEMQDFLEGRMQQRLQVAAPPPSVAPPVQLAPPVRPAPVEQPAAVPTAPTAPVEQPAAAPTAPPAAAPVAAAAPAVPTPAPAPAVPAPPRWLVAGRHEKYPPAEFLSVIGVASDIAAAEKAAMEELAAQVTRHVATAFQRYAAADRGDPLAQNLRALGRPTAPTTVAELPSAVIAERWHDPVTHTCYALGVLDRTTAVLVQRQRIDKARQRGSDLSAAAQDQEKAGSDAAALRGYLDALTSARAAVTAQLVTLAVARDADAESVAAAVPDPLLAQIPGRVRSLVAGLRIVGVSGDGQWASPSTAPKEPFVVQVSAEPGGRPVADMPVRLVTTSRTRQSIGSAVTDEQGLARCLLMAAPAAGGAARTAFAEPDLEALGAAAGRLELDVPRVEFRFAVHSRASSWFAFALAEEDSEQPVTSALAQALRGAGYGLAEQALVEKHLSAGAVPAGASDEDLVRALSAMRTELGPGRCLLILAGRAQIEPIETVATSQGPLHIAAYSYSFRLLDAEMPGPVGPVLAVSGAGKGAYANDALEAIRRAREDAATSAAARLLQGLDEKFGPAR